MRVVVTIFDGEFRGKAAIESKAKQLCDINDIIGGRLYIPRTGMLVEFIELLRENHIRYYPGIHFSIPSNRTSPQGPFSKRK